MKFRILTVNYVWVLLVGWFLFFVCLFVCLLLLLLFVFFCFLFLFFVFWHTCFLEGKFLEIVLIPYSFHSDLFSEPVSENQMEQFLR